jgi:hypothetical protein
MSDSVWRIPSKVIQYGYIEVPSPTAAYFDPAALAKAYVEYVYAFQRAEQEAVNLLAQGLKEGPAESHTEPTQEAKKEWDAEAAKLLKEELGATEIDSHPEAAEEETEGNNPPPWKKKVATPKKAWQDDAEDSDW